MSSAGRISGSMYQTFSSDSIAQDTVHIRNNKISKEDLKRITSQKDANSKTVSIVFDQNEVGKNDQSQTQPQGQQTQTQPKDTTNNVTRQPFEFPGWKDAEQLKKYQEIENDILCADINYYNGNIPEFHKYSDWAIGNGYKKDSPSGKRFWPQFREISLYTKPIIQVSSYWSKSNIRPEFVNFIDENNMGADGKMLTDGVKQPWEKYSYIYNADSTKIIRPDYKLSDVKQPQNALTTQVSYIIPNFDFEGKGFNTKNAKDRILDLQGTLIVDLLKTDYNGTLNTGFNLYSFINPDHPEYTLNYLKKLNGNEYTACEFGPVYSQHVLFGLAQPLFGTLPEMPQAIRWLVPILVNKLSATYENTLTEMSMRAFPNYAYNESTKNLANYIYDYAHNESTNILAPEGIKGLFVSDLQSLTLGFESRTLTMLKNKWPYSIYPALIFKYKFSWLSSNMPDPYYLSEKYYVPPFYDKDVKLTQAQRDTIMNDYVNNYLPERSENKGLTANEMTLGARVNFPGFAQLLTGMGILSIPDGGADQTKTLFQYTITGYDPIRNTGGNGLSPAYLNHFAEYHLDESGNLVKVGSNYHAPIEPYKGHSWRFSLDNNIRLSKGPDLDDKGNDITTGIYMPVGFSIGGGSYTVGGVKKHSSEWSFNIGLGITDQATLRYTISKNNNGYDYDEAVQSLTFTWMFDEPKKHKK